MAYFGARFNFRINSSRSPRLQPRHDFEIMDHWTVSMQLAQAAKLSSSWSSMRDLRLASLFAGLALPLLLCCLLVEHLQRVQAVVEAAAKSFQRSAG